MKEEEIPIKDDYGKLQEKIDMIEKRLSHAEDKLTQHTSLLERILKKIPFLSSKNSDNRKETEELKEEKSALKNKIRDLNDYISNLNSEKEKLKEKIITKDKEINELQAELKERKADLEKTEQKNQELTEENKKLKEEIEKVPFKKIAGAYCNLPEDIKEGLKNSIKSDKPLAIFISSLTGLKALYEQAAYYNREKKDREFEAVKILYDLILNMYAESGLCQLQKVTPGEEFTSDEFIKDNTCTISRGTVTEVSLRGYTGKDGKLHKSIVKIR
jgi:chromosome segregation ATPase